MVDPTQIKIKDKVLFEIGLLRLAGIVVCIINLNGQPPSFIVETNVGTSEVKSNQLI